MIKIVNLDSFNVEMEDVSTRKIFVMANMIALMLPMKGIAVRKYSSQFPGAGVFPKTAFFLL